ncbi:MAG: SGNH/GDSL hydrolase family protein, partial [bacterium]|nr:SGNH/GDSL hydrolase family protein [bacterium]
NARWWPLFRAEDFFGDTCFDEPITRWLWELRVLRMIDTSPDPLFASIELNVSPTVRRRYGFRCVPKAPPLLVSSIVDAYDIEEAWHRAFIVAEDDAPPWLPQLPSYEGARVLERAEAEARIRERLAPLVAGVRALRDAGAPKLLVLGCTPPAPYDYEGSKPVRLRANVRRLMDRVLADACAELGVHFVPMDALVGDAGIRDERFFFDPEHFNEAGGCRLLETVLPLLD